MTKHTAFTDEERAAMTLVESLIHQGKLTLAPDRWNQGRLMFMRPHHVQALAPDQPREPTGVRKILQTLVVVGRMGPNEARKIINGLDRH